MISVILPCYRAAIYLNNIANDLICQDYTDFEAIFINDGDHQQDVILQEIVSRDSRFKTIWKENGGQSSARNVGINIALGEWIVCVDPDDRIAPYYLNSLYNCVKDSNAELGMGGYISTPRNSSKINEFLIDEDLCKRGIVSLAEFYNYIEDKTCFRSAWAKIYRRSIIQQNNIRNDEKYICAEDWKFNLDYFLVTKRVGLTRDCGYKYITGNEQSSISAYVPDPVSARMIIIDKEEKVRRLIGRSEEVIAKQRKADTARLCYEIIKNMFCGRNHPNLRSSSRIIRDEIISNKMIVEAIKGTPAVKTSDKIQKMILLTQNAWFIALAHKVLYFIHYGAK